MFLKVLPLIRKYQIYFHFVGALKSFIPKVVLSVANRPYLIEANAGAQWLLASHFHLHNEKDIA